MFLLLTALSLSAAPTMSELVSASQRDEWHQLDPENLLYMDFGTSLVVIELAPAFAPKHVANIKTLVRQGYFDGLAFMRSQDNYVVQWGDADGKKPVGKAKATLKAEFTASNVPGFTPLGDADVYAPEVGFVGDFPAARNQAEKLSWLTHCYGMVGAGRDESADSGGGTELYAVIGHAPRHLDRNVTLVGRVIMGMESLATLPRGTAELGFYDKPEQRVPITRLRVAADSPADQRLAFEALRTDSATYKKILEARKNRSESWYKYQVGHLELCNAPIIVRPMKS